MLFTTLHFAAFLLFTFLVFHLVPGRFRRAVMLVSSVYFYASWSVPYLALIAAQLCVDWSCGYWLSRSESTSRRKWIVVVSLVVNLSSLCLFKYYGFFLRTLDAVGFHLPPLELTLPLGISFYTFESMSYTIDVYRRRLQPVRSPLHLALFVTWFPHLIAGPIIRPAELVPQLGNISPVTRERFFSGLQLLALGYCKKLLGADWLAKVADPIFLHPHTYTSLELLVGVYAYAFQIYLDFSAYTDIARGASRWFGIELPENFNAPYLATSITDFWRRWHMTLSHWLRDYLYLSLGGNRKGHARTYINLCLTMLLGGLWHGAAWTFVAWGGLHGIYLAVERALGVQPEKHLSGLSRVVRTLLTFHLVCAAWVLFRARSFADAAEIFRGIASLSLHVTREMLPSVLGVTLLVIAYWLVRPLRPRLLLRAPFGGPLLFSALMGGVLVVYMLLGASSNAFIYFQF